MKKFILGMALFVCTSAIGSPSVFAASEDESTEVTVNYVTEQEAMELKEQSDQIGYDEDYDVSAFETDLNGNTIEVDPIGNVSLQRTPPKDGFTYVPSNYTQSSGSVNNRFKSLGSFTLNNSSSTAINATYTQQDTITANWSVNSSISGSATFKAKFIGQVEAKVASGASYSKTVSKGQKYTAGGTVGPKKSINMYAYQKGGKSSGKLYWNKYSSSGSMLGVYSETTSGGTAPVSGVTIDVTN